MDLLEYQAKEIFAQVGIPILPSQPIHEPGGLKRLNIPYPIVLKSQVRTGGRGKAGGVRFVANTIDAIAAAHAIFHLPIAGEYPEVILAEARYNPQQEIFLAILLDYHLQRPVLLGASQGGDGCGQFTGNHAKSGHRSEIFPLSLSAISRIYGFKRVFDRVYQSNSRKNV